MFWLKLLPCQCVHLSSGHMTPITWIPAPSYFCWAMRWQHQWISPSPCPCGSWLVRLLQSDRRSVVIPLQQAEVIVLYNTDTSYQQNSTGYIHFAVHEYAESVLWLILSKIMNGRLLVFRFVNCRHYYDLVVNQIKFMKRKNIGQIDCLILISNSLNVLSTSKPKIPTP